MPELSVPAFSFEGLAAAAQNGADSIYIRAEERPAKKSRVGFSYSDISAASEYCRVRGIKLYVMLDSPAYDTTLTAMLSLAQKAQQGGADALIVRDFGLLRALRSYLPEMPLHLSAEGGIRDLDGAKFARKLGASRVLLSPELPKERVCLIARNAGIETEISCYGPMCMSYAGTCRLGAVAPHRTKNAGLCGRPCLLPFSMGGKVGVYPLCLKPNDLLNDMGNVALSEVTAIRIDSADEKNEHIAIASRVASHMKDRSGRISDSDAALLSAVLPKCGTTNAFFDGSIGPHMLGTPDEAPYTPSVLSDVRSDYLGSERPRIPLSYYAVIKKGKPIRLGAQDDIGNIAAAEGTLPEPAFHKQTTKVTLQTQLFRSENTPYTLGSLRCNIDEGLFVPREKLEPLKNAVYAEMTEKRKALNARPVGEFLPVSRYPGSPDKPKTYISVLRAAQLSPELAEKEPDMLIVPLNEFSSFPESVIPFLSNGHTVVALALPRIIWDGEDDSIHSQLKRAFSLGVRELFISNPGHIRFGTKYGFTLHGDYGLEITNSETMDIYAEAGLVSAALPFDLPFSQIGTFSKPIDTEIMVYGRLPLMVTENCIIKNNSGICTCSRPAELRDKNGAAYPVIRSSGCRNTVYSPLKLFLADRQRQYASLGLSAVRLSFTTENPRECVLVTERYLGESDYEPGGCFRGLYGIGRV